MNKKAIEQMHTGVKLKLNIAVNNGNYHHADVPVKQEMVHASSKKGNKNKERKWVFGIGWKSKELVCSNGLRPAVGGDNRHGLPSLCGYVRMHHESSFVSSESCRNRIAESADNEQCNDGQPIAGREDRRKQCCVTLASSHYGNGKYECSPARLEYNTPSSVTGHGNHAF